MSVVFQIAGKARHGRAEEIKTLVAEFEPALRTQAGFEKARLLVSYATLQTQLLLYWDTYENGLAYNQGEQKKLGARLAPLMENNATLITSVLEAELGSLSQAGQTKN